MNPKEMREQRAKLVADAQALIPAKGSISAENRTKFDALMAEADTLKADIDRVERSAAAEKELRATQAPPNAPINAAGAREHEDEEKQNRAFRNYLRCGISDANLTDAEVLDAVKESRGGTSSRFNFSSEKHGWAFRSREDNAQRFFRKLMASAETRTTFSDFMGVTPSAGALGGFLVPTGFVYDVDVATKFYGDILNEATEMVTDSGNPMPYPTSNDTGTVGELVGEGVQVSDAEIAVGHVTFGAYKYSTKMVPVSLELLQDSAFNLEEFIKNAFAIRLGRILNTHMTVGSGSAQPNGIITAATASGQTVVGDLNATDPNPDTQVGYDDLVNLEHSIDRSYRRGAKFMAHDSTIRSLKLLKDKYGRPLWAPGIQVNAPDTILSYEYAVNNDMDQIGTTSPVSPRNTVAFGQLKKYIVRKVKELSVLRLVERYADYGLVSFIGFARYDGNLIDAGTHPVKYLTNPVS